MLRTAEALVRVLPGCEVGPIEVLRSSPRSRVERVRLAGDPDRVVVKYFAEAGGFVAEAAALSVVPPGAPAPTLVGEDREQRLVVMTDAGEGPSVADALLGADPARAERALVAWGVALAALHRTTAGLGRAFAAAVTERAAGGEGRPEPVSDSLAGVPAALAAAGVDLADAGGVSDELAALAGALGAPGWEALSPGDTCPDNNVVAGDGLSLVDFEEATFRHVAWDLAYLRVPWPSCWCAWAIPEPSAAAALDGYFSAMDGTVVGADRGAFERTVDLATLGWLLVAGSWYLPGALRRDDTVGTEDLPGPPRRAAVLERFGAAATAARRLGFPALASAAGSLHATLRRSWGPLRLPTAPAFHAVPPHPL